MASPQIENGHTQIANELIEHLAQTHLSPNQWQVLLCIIRKTYGFHKKVDDIANSQIGEATGLCKAVVSRALQSLHRAGMIKRDGKKVGIQKDWEGWGKLAEPSTLTPKVSSIANSQKLAEPSTLASELAEPSTPQKLAIPSQELAISSTKVSSCAVAQKIKETIQKKHISSLRKIEPPKKVYGEFQNVLLSDMERQKLQDRFGEQGSKERIEALSEGIASKGYKYHSHYATILNWERMHQKEGSNHDGANRGHTQKGLPGNQSAGAFADIS